MTNTNATTANSVANIDVKVIEVGELTTTDNSVTSATAKAVKYAPFEPSACTACYKMHPCQYCGN